MAVFIPIFLGIAGILQGTLNKNISQHIGLAHAVLLSNFLVLLLSVAFYYYVQAQPQNFPAFFQVKTGFLQFKWWYLIPGIFGFCIVLGLPYAFSKLGAVQVTIYLIAAQLIASALWDAKVDNTPLGLQKIIGMSLALLSMIVLNYRR